MTIASVTLTMVAQNDSWDPTAAYHSLIVTPPGETTKALDLTSTVGTPQTLTVTFSPAPTFEAALATSITEGEAHAGSPSDALTDLGTGGTHYWRLLWDDFYHDGSGKVFSLLVDVEHGDGSHTKYAPTLVEPHPEFPSLTNIVGDQPVLDESQASYVTWERPYSDYAFYVAVVRDVIPPLRQHPRDDGLGLSGTRRPFGNRSQQASDRRVGGDFL